MIYALLGLGAGIALGAWFPVVPPMYSKLVAVAFMGWVLPLVAVGESLVAHRGLGAGVRATPRRYCRFPNPCFVGLGV